MPWKVIFCAMPGTRFSLASLARPWHSPLRGGMDGGKCCRHATIVAAGIIVELMRRNMKPNNITLTNRVTMSIKLKKEVEQRLLGSIQRYCAANLDEEVGELKAKLLLDYCLREIGPSVYNQAILDAQAAMQDKIAEVETVCYETEFAYWKK
ncbi:DUF2164 domain-containing protein [Rugamonas sp. CCM 8940]|uniref:DUF2164 domain-containing protein n=1 Tax=Rugamonas sp. CCM 8940 TaxID=2765359 RepID=UPI001F17616E|nr:DUF2164 domain-containing protein [Rugamonas sp. CCM 8940]